MALPTAAKLFDTPFFMANLIYMTLIKLFQNQTVSKDGHWCEQNVKHSQIDGIIHRLSRETIEACKYELGRETCQIFVKEILH